MNASSREELRRSCLRLIRANITNPALSQEWLAAQLHVSRRHLNRALEGGPGTTELVARCRLAAAVHLMRSHPDLSLRRIAALAGYANYETLRSQTRRLLDRSPSELRAVSVRATPARRGATRPLAVAS